MQFLVWYCTLTLRPSPFPTPCVLTASTRNCRAASGEGHRTGLWHSRCTNCTWQCHQLCPDIFKRASSVERLLSVTPTSFSIFQAVGAEHRALNVETWRDLEGSLSMNFLSCSGVSSLCLAYPLLTSQQSSTLSFKSGRTTSGALMAGCRYVVRAPRLSNNSLCGRCRHRAIIQDDVDSCSARCRPPLTTHHSTLVGPSNWKLAASTHINDWPWYRPGS
ncbi:hypothetical protein BDZ89DRAFT_271927 [Hymenopellis radicata]|nr:hypothetical protein BDZ89DRAFT_271927 [Hymenopellis radicata]